MENAFIASFNGTPRDECLYTRWFLDLADARARIEHWGHDYSIARPHSALADCSPSTFARQFCSGSNINRPIAAVPQAPQAGGRSPIPTHLSIREACPRLLARAIRDESRDAIRST